MKVIVYLRRGGTVAFLGASHVPASMATPYYLVSAADGHHYFPEDAVERISVLKTPEDA